MPPICPGDALRVHVRLPPGAVAEQRFYHELILLSEVIYYLRPARIVGRLAARVSDSLIKGGSVILVHWTGPTNYHL